MKIKISLELKKRPKPNDKINIQDKIEVKIVQINSEFIILDINQL